MKKSFKEVCQKLKSVYVKHENDTIEVAPEYVYMTIPAEYIKTYYKILTIFVDYGEDMLKDCKASCKDRNSNVIDCFNMFNAAVAARKLGKDKLAETIIKYVDAQLKSIYKGAEEINDIVFPIDKEGHLKAVVTGTGKLPIFQIDVNSGILFARDNDDMQIKIDSRDLKHE